MAVFYIHELCLAVFLFGSVHIRGQEAGCNASVTEGGSAKLTFLLRNALNTSSDSFYAYLRRNKDPESDILRCFRLDASTDVECTATTPQYKAGKLVNHRLNMFIPNVTRDFEDTYVLRVYVNDSPESPISCTLTVKAIKSEEQGQDKFLWIVFPVIGISVLLIMVIAVVCWHRRRKRTGNKTRYSTPQMEEGCITTHTPTSSSTNDKEPETSVNMTSLSNVSKQNIRQEHTSSTPLLDKTPTAERQNESPETSVDMTSLSNVSTQNIRQDDTSAPLLDKTPTAERQNESPKTSINMTLLTNLPTQNIRQEDTSATPLLDKTPTAERQNESTRMSRSEDTGRVEAKTREKPETSDQHDLKDQTWYFGGTTNEQAQLLLASDRNGHGSFLVIDSGILNEYRLKAKFQGHLRSYSIRPSGKGFYIDQRLVFESVTKLIDYYQKNSRSSLPDVLSTPCVR